MTLVMEALARPRGGSSAPEMLGVIVALLLPLALVGVALLILRARRRQVRDAARAAFGGLGLTPSSYGLTGCQGSGMAAHGRALHVILTAGQKNAPSSLTVEIACGAGFEMSVSRQLPSSARWLRGLLIKGEELQVPELTGLSIHTNDPVRARHTASRGGPALMALLFANGAEQVRYVYVRAGRAQLKADGDALRLTTAASLSADVANLVAAASIAEQ